MAPKTAADIKAAIDTHLSNPVEKGQPGIKQKDVMEWASHLVFLRSAHNVVSTALTNLPTQLEKIEGKIKVIEAGYAEYTRTRQKTNSGNLLGEYYRKNGMPTLVYQRDLLKYILGV